MKKKLLLVGLILGLLFPNAVMGQDTRISLRLLKKAFGETHGELELVKQEKTAYPVDVLIFKREEDGKYFIVVSGNNLDRMLSMSVAEENFLIFLLEKHGKEQAILKGASFTDVQVFWDKKDKSYITYLMFPVEGPIRINGEPIDKEKILQ